jgi:6-phosphogluconolactonase
MRFDWRPFSFLILVGAMLSNSVQADDPLVFISAFAPGDQGAIQGYQVDQKAGRLKLVHKTTGVENPFFLALSPDRKFLYSIHAKTFGGKEPEEIAAYQLVGRTGELKLLNRRSSHGTASCYLDATDGAVLVANYSSGNIASLSLNRDRDGSLSDGVSVFQHKGSSVNPERQKEPHPHCIVVSPDKRFALVADLGLDQVRSYRRDVGSFGLGRNEPWSTKTPAGAGPRHLTFHPNGKLVYVINEISNTLSVFDYNAETGVLTDKQAISTVPADFKGTSHTADVKITPNGRFLYGTNRGHDSIAAYRIGDDGKLTLIGIEPSLGKGPQNLAILPGGELLLCANMPGNNVVAFRIDPQTGVLKSVGEPVAITSPSCIMVLP